MSESGLFYGLLPSRSISSAEASLSIRDACELVESGDLVLFSDYSWSASFITLSCASRFSHVGIIYRRPGEKPSILEAVKHPGRDTDVFYLKPEAGVRLIDFENHLRYFNGKSVAIRTILTRRDLNAAKPMRKHMGTIVGRIWESARGKKYSSNILDFLLSRFPIVEKKSDSFDNFFCSKLVAWCYLEAGLLDTSIMPSSYLPDDFSSTGNMSLHYPNALPFPGLNVSNHKIIRLSDELYINTKIP